MAYRSVVPEFWTGETGRRLRAAGADHLLLALYLSTGPSSTMTGLYYLPMPTIAHALGWGIEGACKVMRGVAEADFVSFSDTEETVFVHSALRVQVGESISPKDKKLKALRQLVEPFRKSELYPAFYEQYAKSHRFADLSPIDGASKGLRRGMHVSPQGQGQNQGQDGEEALSARARVVELAPSPTQRQIAHEIWNEFVTARSGLILDGIRDGGGAMLGNQATDALLEMRGLLPAVRAFGADELRRALEVAIAEARKSRSLRWLDGKTTWGAGTLSYWLSHTEESIPAQRERAWASTKRSNAPTATDWVAAGNAAEAAGGGDS